MDLVRIKNSVADFQQRDIRWMERIVGGTIFFSGFWATHGIRRAIERHASRAHGVLLDVGCGLKPYESFFAPHVTRYLGTEYSSDTGFRGNRADFGADAGRLPLADESVDTILCTEVLEHVKDPEGVIAEFARVLRPDGVLITTAPFFYPIHDSWDYFRYTDKGLAEMMTRKGLVVETVEPLSGSGTTIAMLINLYWFEVGFLWTKWLYPIGIALRPLLVLIVMLVNVLGWIADKIVPSTHMAFDHITIAKKTTAISE